MKIVIVGSGAIGSLYGAFLSRVDNNEVILIGRSPHITTVQKNGLRVKGVMGEHHLHIRASEDAGDVSEGDLVIITTKTYDTIPAALSAKHIVDQGAYVLLIQNGLGTEMQVAEVLDTTRVLRATTCMGALQDEPGIVEVTGYGLTEVGSHYEENQSFVETITDMLRSAGFEVRFSRNIQGVVWTKTLVNCGINPVGALTGLSNGEVYENRQLRGLVVRLVEEGAKIVEALGIELTTEDPVRYALGTAKATGENINSMLQDLQAKKRTEIDAITGEIIRLGKELGIDTPSNESVYALVKAVESQYLSSREKTKEHPMQVEELVKAVSTS